MLETALTTGMIALAAALAAVSARADRQNRRRWVALTLCLASMSAAEATHLSTAAAAPFVYPPVLAATAGFLWSSVSRRQSRRLVSVGLGLLALSLVVHVLGPPMLAQLGWHAGSWEYRLKVDVKHATEVAGWTIVAAAIASGLRLGRRRPAARAA